MKLLLVPLLSLLLLSTNGVNGAPLRLDLGPVRDSLSAAQAEEYDEIFTLHSRATKAELEQLVEQFVKEKLSEEQQAQLFRYREEQERRERETEERMESLSKRAEQLVEEIKEIHANKNLTPLEEKVKIFELLRQINNEVGEGRVSVRCGDLVEGTEVSISIVSSP